MLVSRKRLLTIASGGAALALFGSLALVAKGCGDLSSANEVGRSATGLPPPNEVPLDPTTIPKFVTQLPILPVWQPTVIRNSSGQVIRNEYTINDSEASVQMLPAGFPSTTVFVQNGTIMGGGNFSGSPGATFENTRNIPTVVHWRTNIQQPYFLPVDPTIAWANPQAIEEPLAPFNLFPPGYQNAQFPVARVTHTHGLVVLPQMDGTANEWFTNVQYRGPSFTTNDYTMPNDQPSTQLFYHDHVLGVTRLGVYGGEVGAAYMIRDPNSPLDAASSPLPKGQFEVVLGIATRAFFTDGQLHFPPDPGTLNAGADAPPNIAYWSYNEGADTVVVNGAAWPNLNVQRRQYRFRMLGAANTQLWDLQFQNASSGNAVVPITIIGSDGGYLPAPQTSQPDVQIGITERADVLVDFSKFAAGTKIVLANNYVGEGSDPTGIGVVMQFTVQAGTAVPPPTLNPSLFPPRAVLTANAPKRVKVLRVFDDLRPDQSSCPDAALVNCNQRSIDGLEFSAPATEFPLVNTTEEWDLVHMMEPRQDDQDKNFHQIHIHLIEFQVLNRQPIDSVNYRAEWHRVNGHMPATRPIVVDPTPFFTGPAQAPAPYETGWKDTFQAQPAMVNRIMVRWAPQESTNNTPGVNQFKSLDPTTFPDNVKGPGYVWHCHIVGHEDHDMLRQLALVNSWKAGTAYVAENVVEFNQVDYRARVNHTAVAGQTPNTRFDQWDRVNNNDGSWQPQIRYALDDRVTFNGGIYRARSVFQSQNGQTPSANPSLWQALPTTYCGQFAQFCQGNSNTNAIGCLHDGQAGNEATCKAEVEPCLAYCIPQVLRPCGGLCNNPVVFSVADGSNFQSGNLGTGATCFETRSRLFQGESTNFIGGKQLTVNGRVEPQTGNWNYPLPPMRNDGYCIQVSAGNQSYAAFAAW
jgi:FtsP/CotA-like multicopper oxidase with cupredoxin domain